MKFFDLYVKTLENLIGPPDELLASKDEDGPFAKWETKGVIVEATITREAVLSEFFEKATMKMAAIKQDYIITN